MCSRGGGSTLTGPKPARARGGLIGIGQGLSPAARARLGRAAPQGTAGGNHSTLGGSNVLGPAVQAGPYGMLPPGMGSQPWGGPPGSDTRSPHPQAFMGQYPMVGSPPLGFWPNMNPLAPYMNHSGFQQYPGFPGGQLLHRVRCITAGEWPRATPSEPGRITSDQV